MLHILSLRDGRASYRNRYIRTPKFLCEQEQGRSVFPCMRDMKPIAPAFLDGVVKMTFTAHPKYDPRTGELHGYSYITPDGNIDYIVLDQSGRARLEASFCPPFPSLLKEYQVS